MSDPLDAFRRQGEIDAAKPLPMRIDKEEHRTALLDFIDQIAENVAFPDHFDKEVAELRAAIREAKIEEQAMSDLKDHKWLDPECGRNGCQSLVWKQRLERAEELADKYKWQVRDTCTRAEKAERERDALREQIAEALAIHETRMGKLHDMVLE